MPQPSAARVPLRAPLRVSLGAPLGVPLRVALGAPLGVPLGAVGVPLGVYDFGLRFRGIGV